MSDADVATMLNKECFPLDLMMLFDRCCVGGIHVKIQANGGLQ